MQRIKFGLKGYDGTYLLIPHTEVWNDTLLAFFIDSTRDNINSLIIDIETVASGEKTFDEIMEDYAAWTFANDSGEFICDKDTARFISLNPLYPSIEMPLQELIDILYEWKEFLGK